MAAQPSKFASIVQRRWARRTFYTVVAVFVIVVLAIWLGVPPAARWAIETVGSRELGRTMHVGTIRMNPFTLNARLSDLVIDGAPGENTPLVMIGEVQANVSATSIWHRAPVLDAVAVHNVAVHVVRLEPQRFDFSDIVDRLLAKQAAPSTEPARFAVHNIVLDGGAIQFDDKVRQQANALTDIRIAIPFISSLPTDVKTEVEPAFFARLDGAAIELKGETLPFEQSLETAVFLKLDGLDVPKYLSFSPVKLNFLVKQGALDADLRIAFRRAVEANANQAAHPSELVISGPVALRDFEVVAPAQSARQRVAWKRLGVSIDEYSVFNDRLRLREVALDAPDVTVVRDAQGRIEGLDPVAPSASTEPAPAPAAAAPPRPFDLTLASLRLSDGRVGFTDETVGKFSKQLEGISVEGHDIATLGDKSAAVKVALHTTDGESVEATAEAVVARRAARVVVSAKEIDLHALAPFVESALRARVEGRVDAAATLGIDAKATPVVIRASELSAAVRKLRVEGAPELGARFELASLAAMGGSIDVNARKVELQKVTLETPRALLTRLKDGSIGWAAIARPSKAPPDPTPAAPWKVAIDTIELTRGDVQFADRSLDPPLALQASALTVAAKNVSADGSTPARFRMRTRIGKAGELSADGDARWDHLAANVRLDARNLDLAALRGYFAEQLNAEFASAELSSRGTLSVAQKAADVPLALKYTGDARLTNVHLLNPGGEDDLLQWQVLALDRLDAGIGSGPPRVEVGAITLSDFYARAVLSSDGRLNLRDIVKSADTAAAPAAAAPASTLPPATDDSTRPVIHLGGITLERGQLNYTDNFVKPNYVANLTSLAGKIGALASDDPSSAEADLTAKIDNDAPVEIKGKLNPLAPQLFLDITGSAHNVDLPRFTPYSAKYAGYPIIKGKLSADVTYKIDHDKLEANNRVFLDQLTFGDHIDSPTATKLPVLLAVALLKNSRGEIDVNLPVSGSLNDPQFSVGGVIVRVILNLLTKAATAPFALIAAAFGGNSEQLGYVEFAPGSAALIDAQKDKLTSLAKALADRPALRLDVIGRADPARDTDGLRNARFDAKLRAEKVRDLVRGGGPVDASKVTVDAAERPALIEKVYSDEKLPDKPRNFLGVAKSIPPAEMEERIRAGIQVGPEDLRALAQERATAVRQQLEADAKIDSSRVFLVEPKLNADGIKDGGATTRVDFALK